MLLTRVAADDYLASRGVRLGEAITGRDATVPELVATISLLLDVITCICDQPMTQPVTPCPVHPHAWKRAKMHGREVSTAEFYSRLRGET